MILQGIGELLWRQLRSPGTNSLADSVSANPFPVLCNDPTFAAKGGEIVASMSISLGPRRCGGRLYRYAPGLTRRVWIGWWGIHPICSSWPTSRGHFLLHCRYAGTHPRAAASLALKL